MSHAETPPWDEVVHPIRYPEQSIDLQLSLLETLFGQAWFLTDLDQKKSHPAYQRWELCRRLKGLGGQLVFPDHRAIAPALASLMLDNVTIAQCSGG